MSHDKYFVYSSRQGSWSSHRTRIVRGQTKGGAAARSFARGEETRRSIGPRSSQSTTYPRRCCGGDDRGVIGCGAQTYGIRIAVRGFLQKVTAPFATPIQPPAPPESRAHSYKTCSIPSPCHRDGRGTPQNYLAPFSFATGWQQGQQRLCQKLC